MRVIVCGGRDYNNRLNVFSVLDDVFKDAAYGPYDRCHFLFHGNAKGADTLAGIWGSFRKDVRVCPVPAEWKKFGKSAGPRRNKAMLGQGATLVVAFPGGVGTADMIRQAEAAGVEVMKII